jgi:hypothetical protein
MGPAKRRRSRRKLRDFSTRTPVYADSETDEWLPDPDIAALLAEAGLPAEFSSTKGCHIDGQENVEAARVGQIRRYQQFQGKKLKEWQIKRLRGARLRQAREKLASRR